MHQDWNSKITTSGIHFVNYLQNEMFSQVQIACTPKARASGFPLLKMKRFFLHAKWKTNTDNKQKTPWPTKD
jgi:hypothetical protein